MNLHRNSLLRTHTNLIPSLYYFSVLETKLFNNSRKLFKPQFLMWNWNDLASCRVYIHINYGELCSVCFVETDIGSLFASLPETDSSIAIVTIWASPCSIAYSVQRPLEIRSNKLAIINIPCTICMRSFMIALLDEYIIQDFHSMKLAFSSTSRLHLTWQICMDAAR